MDNQGMGEGIPEGLRNHFQAAVDRLEVEVESIKRLEPLAFEALKDIFAKGHNRVKLVLAKDGSGIGAAILAAVASKK